MLFLVWHFKPQIEFSYWNQKCERLKLSHSPRQCSPWERFSQKRKSLTWAMSSQSRVWPKREGVGTKMRCKSKQCVENTNTETSPNASNLEVINNFIITPDLKENTSRRIHCSVQAYLQSPYLIRHWARQANMLIYLDPANQTGNGSLDKEGWRNNGKLHF